MPTISSGSLSALLQMTAFFGSNPAQEAKNLGLEAEQLSDPDLRIKFFYYQKLWQRLLNLSGNPQFALEFGASFNREVLMQQGGIVGLMFLNSKNLEVWLSQIRRYAHLVREVNQWRFEVEADLVGFEITQIKGAAQCIPNLELNLSGFSSWCRAELNQAPNKLELAFPAPAHAEKFSEIFACPVHFDCPKNTIWYDQACLTQEFKGSNATLFESFSIATEELGEVIGTGHWSNLVAKKLLVGLPLGMVKMESIAALLGTNKRSLTRRLQEEGNGFKAIITALRHSLSLKYLSEKKYSIGEIAFLLGYSDQANFNRAFLGWQGQAPREIRNLSY